MADGLGIAHSFVRILPLVISLAGLTGCSEMESIKSTLRAASGTMVRIADLSLRFEGSSAGGKLEKVEARVTRACQNLLDSADYRFRGKEVPLDTQLEVVLTKDECQSVVDQAQPELKALQAEGMKNPGDRN